MNLRNEENKYTSVDRGSDVKISKGGMHISEDLFHVKPDTDNGILEDAKKKPKTREAAACGTVYLKLSTLEKIEQNEIIKGNVIEYARVAGIMASKNASKLIPSATLTNLQDCNITFNMDNRNGRINIIATTIASGNSDAEIAALTAVSISALTIYNMCVELDRSIIISDIKLLKNITGNPGGFLRP